MGYLIAAAVVFLFIGLFLFLRPDLFWKLTEQWKSYSADEPSKLYRISTKVGGALLAAFGIVLFVLALVVK